MDLNTIHRKQLIEKLYTQGIKDINVLKAMGKVRRELFVKDEFKKYSYENIALPLSSNQTISQPYTVAFMTEKLKIEKGDKVLEVGTGSGYQSAVLCELGAEVFTIERIKELFEIAGKRFYDNGYKVTLKNDDGTKGWIEFSPFDKIIVTAGSPKIPRKLLDQLNSGGRMIIPVGDEVSQELILIKKNGKDDACKDKSEYVFKSFKDFKFVPLIGEEGWSLIK